MSKILYKELKLSAHILSFVFICFGLLFFCPGYPILCAAMFVTLGIYQSFQNTRETNDILFSALLPIDKKDVVKGKFVFVCFIELCGLLLMSIITFIRMNFLSDSIVYRNNFLMNANLFALALVLVIFGLFNLIFVSGFFKTAYKTLKYFIYYLISTFVVIVVAEVLHHIPNLEFLNSFGYEHIGIQLLLLFIGILLFVLMTYVSYKISCRRFEKIDL